MSPVKTSSPVLGRLKQSCRIGLDRLGVGYLYYDLDDTNHRRGDDTITSNGANATINAGLGNDLISLASGTSENLIEYRAGDDSDTISGFNASDTLSIANDVEYTPVVFGSDIVIAVGTDSITLSDAARLI